MNLRKRYLLGWLALSLTCACAHAQRIGLKTNALYWATASPNFGLELRMNRHFTVNLEGTINYLKVKNIDTKFAGFTPELRWWYSARPWAGHFIGMMALGSAYDVTYDGKMHNGMAWGFGPTYGYAWVLGKRWTMEATVGAGFLRIREKKRTDDFQLVGSEPNNRRWLFAPLKVGLNFIYLIR